MVIFLPQKANLLLKLSRTALIQPFHTSFKADDEQTLKKFILKAKHKYSPGRRTIFKQNMLLQNKLFTTHQ